MENQFEEWSTHKWNLQKISLFVPKKLSIYMRFCTVQSREYDEAPIWTSLKTLDGSVIGLDSFKSAWSALKNVYVNVTFMFVL
jgi:hypothetical protein